MGYRPMQPSPWHLRPPGLPGIQPMHLSVSAMTRFHPRDPLSCFQEPLGLQEDVLSILLLTSRDHTVNEHLLSTYCVAGTELGRQQ